MIHECLWWSTFFSTISYISVIIMPLTLGTKENLSSYLITAVSFWRAYSNILSRRLGIHEYRSHVLYYALRYTAGFTHCIQHIQQEEDPYVLIFNQLSLTHLSSKPLCAVTQVICSFFLINVKSIPFESLQFLYFNI